MEITAWDEGAASSDMVGAAARTVPLRETVAFFCIGCSSWLLVSGVFAAAVWKIETAPEGSTLFAHLDVAIQTPNLIAALLVLATPSGFVPRHAMKLTAALLALGVFGAVWLTAAADLRTATASVGLLIGAAAGGTVGATSMVIFFPLAATTAASTAAVARQISALSAGIGTCGVVAQVLSGAHVQGAAYFGVIIGVQLLGLLALAVLICARRASESTEFLVRATEGVAIHEVRESGGGASTEATGPTPGAWCVRWLTRHVDGMRSTGCGALAGIGVSCVLEFAMPGLLPYLVAPSAGRLALFWLTCLWAVSSVIGRAVAARRPLRVCELVPANCLQAALLIGAIACAATQSAPPLGVAAPLVALFSIAHGLVVTSVYVLAGATDAAGTTYAGLANQGGALLGSLLSLALVSSGLLPKK